MDFDEKVGRTLVIGALIWFVAATQPTPVTRTVDDDDPSADFSSIQPAINVSSSGDVILVRCGLYVENLSIKDGVSVIGERPDCTILDGDASGSVVTFINVRSLTELSGFTIQNGSSSKGGGIFLDYSSPIITRNVIVGNEALKDVEGYDGWGGGIAAYNDSYPTVTNNLIAGNSAEFTGGGMDISYDSFPTLRNNTIVGNSAFFGGGVYSLWSEPSLESNIIADNTAEAGGGGLDFVNSPHFTIERPGEHERPADSSRAGQHLGRPVAPSVTGALRGMSQESLSGD
jgi:parallel beta-helix repeat protein